MDWLFTKQGAIVFYSVAITSILLCVGIIVYMLAT